eukprot:gnl/Spiro4/22423_TR11054_c0_g1_i1.p1 gnl/Spiro4/22423_TR11054_c0_g1~~gnl/Spiro4/22423_TR11054_c0_g1_i1.p1  ORF type:complete len:551 (-),score=65.06 gnl/Spiro4/22423_TR11054_c0_g1_i1:65-1717(-)
MASQASLVSSLALAGERSQGQDIRSANVTAAMAVANIVRSSLGPIGLDKMIVDDIGDVTITNDGATILKLLEVEHPAAKILVELAGLQDQEVGDGTTSVVILAAELLRRGNELVKNKIHPISVISGFRLASREAIKFLEAHMKKNVSVLPTNTLLNVTKTTLSSKLISGQEDKFAKLAVKAMQSVRTVNSRGEVKYPLKAVSILKCPGQSSETSTLVDGFALNCTRASQAMLTRVAPARIALLDINLQKYRLQMGVQVRVTDPKQLELIRQRELDITRDRIQKIIAAGANVILTTKGIDDQHLKYLVEAGVIGVRRCKKSDLAHIAKATGGVLMTSMVDMSGEETFDPAMLGHAEEVSEERVSDNELIFIRGCRTSKACSILLRGPSSYMLDEMDRSLHDALCIIKRTLESQYVVPGGGCVETALSIFLENFATSLGSREQLAIVEFAQALLVIPKTLAINAAQDATELIAQLRSYHYTSQSSEGSAEFSNFGLDLTKGSVRDNLEAGVLEPAMSKIKSLQFATEAAITILRIDDFIKMQNLEAEGGGGH